MLMSSRSPLAELNILKKICDHPRLLSTLACEQLGLDEEDRFVVLLIFHLAVHSNGWIAVSHIKVASSCDK